MDIVQKPILMLKNIQSLRGSGVSQVHFSSYSTSKRGLTILMHKNTPCIWEKCIKDEQGRYVIIRGHENSKEENVDVKEDTPPEYYKGADLCIMQNNIDLETLKMLQKNTVMKHSLSCRLSPTQRKMGIEQLQDNSR